jgi:glycosyltransferase involved in cell wall biosynthesis
MGQADVLFSISRFVTRSLLHSSYQAAKIRELLNAIDIKNWDCGLSAISAREELGLAQNVPVIVCIARLFPAKGQGELIRALPAVQKRWPDVKVLIVGSDDRSASGGASYSNELSRLACELGLESNVSFLGYRSDIARVLAASDVFCLPSFEEPFGLVFLEAMAMKKPVVALNNGGTPEVVVHGETGLLSEPGDTEALARNLLTLLGDPTLRVQMGNRGRTLVENRFDKSRMVRDAEQFYIELIRGVKEG